MVKLPAAQAAELMHRRCHAGVGKLRGLAHTTRNTPKILSPAPVANCDASAVTQLKRTSHGGSTLDASEPEPGVLHLDIKEFVLSRTG